MSKGDTLFNVKDKKWVRINRIVKMHANKMEDVDKVYPGEIYAMFGIECDSGTTFIKNEK